MLPTYRPGDAAAYASARGWQYKAYGDELILKECPFCGRKDKLYWNNASGAFECKSAHCGQKGNYFTLRRDVGDPVQPLAAPTLQVKKPRRQVPLENFKPYEEALWANEAALVYLRTTRGLTDETIRRWHLGLKREPYEKHEIDSYRQDIDWLLIPYINRQGMICDAKYRSLPPAPKFFKRWGGGDSILFGEYFLPEKKQTCDVVYLVEGEVDAITLDQYGFRPAVSTTTGAGSFNPRWYDLIVGTGAKRLVVIYDSDVDGRAGAERVVKKFNDDQREVLDIILPDAKDSNEYLKTHAAENLHQLIADARPAEIEYVYSAATVLDRLEERLFNAGGAFDGIPTQFTNLNDLIDGGWANSTLNVVIGGSGTGKTSFLLQDLVHVGTNFGPGYMCCLEMPEEMVMAKVINHLYHIPLRGIKLEHIQEYRKDIERRNLFFGKGVRDLKVLDRTFRQAAKRYDLRIIIFDNIHYLVRDDIKNQAAEIGLVTRTLKDLAVDLGIPIVAIAQPKMFDRSERVINENDVKGSSSIEQDSDNMILMWRPTVRTDIKEFGKSVGVKHNMSPLTLFRVGKARYSAGGETLLYFHGDIGTFRQLSDEETKKLIGETKGDAE